MKPNFSNTAIGRLRMVGIAEGISYLFLLGVAMPLKYFAAYPEAVKYTGWIHGLLFILFVMVLFEVRFSLHWSLKKMLIAFVASLLPFGTFILDQQWRLEEKVLVNKTD